MADSTSQPAPEVRRRKVESLTRDSAGRLVAHVAGRDAPAVDARIARCFPWSLPGRYLSVLDKDGKEIACLASLDELDDAGRRIAEEELHDKVFNPRIIRIIKHKQEFGVTSVRAETDRGEIVFQIRSRDDIRVLSPERVLFRDADGNTYDSGNLGAMDPASRRFIEEFI